MNEKFHVRLQKTIELQPVFSYQTQENFDSKNCELIFSIGKSHLGFAVVGLSGNNIYQIVWYDIAHHLPDTLKQLPDLYPVLKTGFEKVKISFAGWPSLLLPYGERDAQEDALLLQAVYGYQYKTITGTSPIHDWQLKVIYQVPEEVFNFCKQQYPQASLIHQKKTTIKVVCRNIQEAVVHIVFYKNNFEVLLMEHNKVLLSATPAYQSASDVTYYLLQLCHQYSLNRNTLIIQISGMIDAHSNINKELIQYFANIQFEHISWKVPADENGVVLPAHFFSVLNHTAACE